MPSRGSPVVFMKFTIGAEAKKVDGSKLPPCTAKALPTYSDQESLMEDIWLASASTDCAMVETTDGLRLIWRIAILRRRALPALAHWSASLLALPKKGSLPPYSVCAVDGLDSSTATA